MTLFFLSHVDVTILRLSLWNIESLGLDEELLKAQEWTACYNRLFCLSDVWNRCFPRLVPTVEDEAVPEGKPQEEIKENQHPDGMFARCKTKAEAVSCGFIVEKYKNFYILVSSFYCLAYNKYTIYDN